MSTKVEATIEDLYKVEGKAELVNGEIILMSPTGGLPSYAGGEIFSSLREYSKRRRFGLAIVDNNAFVVNLPHRKSFSPNVAFYVGALTMKFFEGAPVFAVEVRSEGDYAPRAERRMAQKRADYFAAGTLVVWDVDLLSENVVRVYRSNDPERATIYRRGEIAEAEPAVPDWTIAVNDLFPEETVTPS
jgi:Uma2 family endonuclease